MLNKFLKTSALTLLGASVAAVAYASPVTETPAENTQNYISVDVIPSQNLQFATHNIPQVNNLRRAKSEYEAYLLQGGWKALRSGDKIEPGQKDVRVPALRRRLSAEGYFTPAENYVSHELIPVEVTVYDEDLVKLVKTFQARHGLDDDGVIGPATVAALNESVESKLNRIDRTLSDWEAYTDLGDTHIWANIPSFKAQAWNNGSLDVEMKTVVGAKRTATNVFSDEIEYMVANPKWFLPTSLFNRQKLRKLQADPSYAANHNYRIYDRASGAEVSAASVDWFEPGIGSRIQMVQDSGPTNALGNVKIIFPNKNSIYLHGTPDTHLFARSNRALSSGCIRLEDPTTMANWIANIDEQVSADEFNKTLDAKTRKHFPLAEHIPVHITYMTVTADEAGQVSFWQDIYGEQDAPKMVSNTYEDYEGAEKSFEYTSFSSASSSVAELN